MMGWDMGWGWMFLSGLTMLLFGGGVITLLVLMLQGFVGNSNTVRQIDSSPHPTPTPVEMLQARYARGEISKQAYKTARQDLQAL